MNNKFWSLDFVVSNFVLKSSIKKWKNFHFKKEIEFFYLYVDSNFVHKSFIGMILKEKFKLLFENKVKKLDYHYKLTEAGKLYDETFRKCFRAYYEGDYKFWNLLMRFHCTHTQISRNKKTLWITSQGID